MKLANYYDSTSSTSTSTLDREIDTIYNLEELDSEFHKLQELAVALEEVSYVQQLIDSKLSRAKSLQESNNYDYKDILVVQEGLDYINSTLDIELFSTLNTEAIEVNPSAALDHMIHTLTLAQEESESMLKKIWNAFTGMLTPLLDKVMVIFKGAGEFIDQYRDKVEACDVRNLHVTDGKITRHFQQYGTAMEYFSNNHYQEFITLVRNCQQAVDNIAAKGYTGLDNLTNAKIPSELQGLLNKTKKKVTNGEVKVLGWCPTSSREYQALAITSSCRIIRVREYADPWKDVVLDKNRCLDMMSYYEDYEAELKRLTKKWSDVGLLKRFFFGRATNTDETIVTYSNGRAYESNTAVGFISAIKDGVKCYTMVLKRYTNELLKVADKKKK